MMRGKRRFGELIPKTRRRRERSGEHVKVAEDARLESERGSE